MSNTLGLTYTTVANARRLFGSDMLGGDSSNPVLLDWLNEIGSYWFTQGTWAGRQARYVFAVPDTGIITLPYFLETLRGARIDGYPRNIVAPSHEFISNGPGDMTPESDGLTTPLIVREGSSVTPIPWPADTADVVTLSGNAADETIAIRLFGVDENGDEIVDEDGAPGESVLIGNDSVQEFAGLTGMDKPITRNPVSVAVGEVSLGSIAAGVQNPVHEQYRVNDSSAVTVTCLCERRWVPVAREEDFIAPWIPRAWKLSLLGREHEANGELKKANEFYQEALRILNSDLERKTATEVSVMAAEPFGFGVGKVWQNY